MQRRKRGRACRVNGIARPDKTQRIRDATGCDGARRASCRKNIRFICDEAADLHADGYQNGFTPKRIPCGCPCTCDYTLMSQSAVSDAEHPRLLRVHRLGLEKRYSKSSRIKRELLTGHKRSISRRWQCGVTIRCPSRDGHDQICHRHSQRH